MAKIAFIGAGSFGFTRSLIKDILTFPLLENSTLALMDIDPERLTYITKAAKKIIEKGKYKAKVISTTSRKEALQDADAVICTILAGGVDVWQHDILIPKKYNVDMNVGDTRSVAGIFRALRTIPVMLDICKDIERYCPNSIFLNYTNPMAMLCHAMQREYPHLKISGLCHSVQAMPVKFAQWLDIPADEITYLSAGINHLSWYLEVKHKGIDIYPQIRKKILEDKNIYNAEQVRNEMFLKLGYYVTESSGHNSEYNWWFRKRPDLIEKYCTHGTDWNPGHYAYILDYYKKREHNWKDEIKKWLADDNIDMKRGHEYASSIINAYKGGEIYGFNGNVKNTGLVTNLPEGCCVEVPVFTDRRGFNPVHVGALPPQVAILTHLSASIEMMTVEASLAGDPTMVYHAVANDPLCAAVLSLEEIKKMVQEMLKINKDYLPQFKKLKIM